MLLITVPVFAEDEPQFLDFEIEHATIAEGDQEFSWSQARCVFVPGDRPKCLVLMQQRTNNHGHGYHDVYVTESEDLGATWSDPKAIPSLQRKKVVDGYEVVAGDLWPAYHPFSNKVLCTGKTFNFRNGTDEDFLREKISYTVYDPRDDGWSDLKTVEIPDKLGWIAPNAGCNQPFINAMGGVMLPVRFQKDASRRNYTSTVAYCTFDGQTLRYRKHGNEMSHPNGRGFYETSLCFRNQMFLTLRTDNEAFVANAVGRINAVHFRDPIPWTFDDRKPLGCNNTQQHWVVHSDGLYLVYTRSDKANQHVFRNRAPLYIARVNPETLQLIRSTERILIPENGRALGNFGVVDVSPSETWVISAEGAPSKGQPWKNNRVILAKIKWNKTNFLFARNLQLSAKHESWRAIGERAIYKTKARRIGSWLGRRSYHLAWRDIYDILQADQREKLLALRGSMPEAAKAANAKFVWQEKDRE